MTIQSELIDLIRKDRARRTRRQKLGKLLGALLSATLLSLANGWLLMLAVAVVHDHWWPMVPTIGYWWAALITYLMRGVFASAPTKDGDR